MLNNRYRNLQNLRMQEGNLRFVFNMSDSKQESQFRVFGTDVMSIYSVLSTLD